MNHIKRGASEFVEYLRTSPVGQEFLAQRRADVRAQRRSLIDRDRALQLEADALLKRAAPAVSKAESAYQAASQQYTVAARALAALRADRDALARRVSSERAAFARELEALADERLSLALGRINARFEGHRDECRLGRIFGTDQQERLMAAFTAARESLKALQYTDVEDLDGAIATIERSIPWDASTTSAA